MDEEIWKDIEGYEGLYQISNLGRIKTISRQGTNTRFIKKDIRKDGYIQVHLTKNSKMKNFLLHRLIAQTFIPNPNNFKYINHKDGNKQNNDISNLEWCTSSQNIFHAYNAGLINRRKKVNQYDKNNNLINTFESVNEASRVTHIDRSHIGACCRKANCYKTSGGYIWRYVNE